MERWRRHQILIVTAFGSWPPERTGAIVPTFPLGWNSHMPPPFCSSKVTERSAKRLVLKGTASRTSAVFSFFLFLFLFLFFLTVVFFFSLGVRCSFLTSMHLFLLLLLHSSRSDKQNDIISACSYACLHGCRSLSTCIICVSRWHPTPVQVGKRAAQRRIRRLQSSGTGLVRTDDC